MEFHAIVDVRVRQRTDCAVIGVYEKGDLTAAARQIDAQTGGLISKLHARGDFAGKVGDTLLLPMPTGAASARVVLVGLGARSAFGRKQYRRALQAAAQAVGRTGAAQAAVYLAAEEAAGLDTCYRARIVAESFCSHAYKIPDLKTAKKPKTALLRSISVAAENRRFNIDNSAGNPTPATCATTRSASSAEQCPSRADNLNASPMPTATPSPCNSPPS